MLTSANYVAVKILLSFWRIWPLVDPFYFVAFSFTFDPKIPETLIQMQQQKSKKLPRLRQNQILSGECHLILLSRGKKFLANPKGSSKKWNQQTSTLRYQINVQYQIIIQGHKIFGSLKSYRYSINIQGDDEKYLFSYHLSSINLSSGNNCISRSTIRKLKNLRSFLHYSMRLLLSNLF